jgi:hypothetical protein
MKRPLAIAGCFTLIALFGCSSDGLATHPVAGVVTLDGRPVEGAGVLFMPADGPPASGTTDAEGRYLLATGEQSGAVPGRHRVIITLMKTTGIEVAPGGMEGRIAPGGIRKQYIVPAKYSKPETSGLTADVAAGNAVHDFALSSK